MVGWSVSEGRCVRVLVIAGREKKEEHQRGTEEECGGVSGRLVVEHRWC